jgi:GT2 family glycosyltransferase
MRWLENGGPQFGYGDLTDGGEVDPAKYFYTCNISVKNEFLLKNGLFDEDFPAAAFEDAELGYRLKAKGLRLTFDRKALGWHRHYTSLKDACGRMVKVGEARDIFNRKICSTSEANIFSPLRKPLRALKLALYYPLALFFEKRKISARIFRYVLSYYYREGLEKARRSVLGK